MKKSEITVLGSLNVDLTINLPRFHVPGETITGTAFHTFLGGKGGNQAVAAAKLGGKVHMIGCVGQDAYGDMYLKEMERLGIDAAHVRREQDAPTGTALIEVDAKGENRIAIVPGANAALNCDLVSDSVETIRASRVLMMQLETPIESINHAAAVAHKLGCTVILDPAPARPVGPEILLLCDYVTPNETELSILTGMPTATQEQAIDACAKLLDMGVKAVVHKRGSKGAMVKKLQQALIALKFLASGEDDGVFGMRTSTAVKAFQKANGLTVDGVVGTKTMVKLQEVLGTQYAALFGAE